MGTGVPRELRRFPNGLENGKQTPIAPYGATNPAEFFAADTETFFEKPRELHK